jgi:hypothetical protein
MHVSITKRTISSNITRHPVLRPNHCVPEAPAGGAAAATPEGGALACPSASPHLPVLGAGNPITVSDLAR